MKNLIIIFVLLVLCLMMSALVSSQGAASLEPDDIPATSSQISRQGLLSFDKFRYLDVPKLDEIMVYDDFECTFKCLHHPLCVSVNLAAEGDFWCELLSFDKYSNPNEYKEKKSSHHYFFESACAKKPCKNNSTCLSGFTDKSYQCLCSAGFKGRTCEEDINECIEGTSNCSADAVCNNTKGSYNCTCKQGYYGDGNICRLASTCKEVFDQNV
ncbi:protein kinase C-binding protein NELL2a-like [Pocillopora verrucosa]|uniref:protein kinase C-binding protein NELL2a-like n=1 Tax=Pocillopora verrucosa TaxID=203993 RepID=UPI00333E2D39